MKKLFLIVSIICFVSCFPANADTRDVAPLEKVSIQLKWFHQFQFAGYYAAAEKGFYAEEGLKVTLKERNTQKSPIRSVLDGDVTYGVADAGLLAERMKGEPVVLLKQIYQHSPLVFLALKKSGIITPYDLVGKKVMVGAEGLSNAALFKMMLTTIGDMGNVTSIPHSYNLDDLITGKVDAVSAYITSQTYKLKQQGIEFYIINPQSFGIDFYGDNLFTTEKEIQAHPDRVKKMIRATVKGWEYALAHPQEIIDLILKKYNPDLNRDQLVYEAKMTDLMILSEITPLGTVTTQRYKEIAETYKNAGLTKTAPIDWRTFIYGSAPEPARNHGILITPQEESWLKQHPVIRLGFTHLEPMVIEDEKGALSGYYVDLFKEINTLLGSSITIELDDIDRTMQKVRNRKVDGLLVSSLPRAFENNLLTTTSLHEVYPIVFASSDAPFAINSLDDLAGKRVAYREDVRAFEKVLKPYKENSTLFPTESTLVSLKMVLEGTADVALGFNVENYLIAKHLISGIKVTFLDLAHSFPAVTAIRNDWPELVSILDKAFETIGTARIEKIYSKWVQVEKQPAASLNLTQLEQDWLEKHPEITLSGGELPGIDFLGKDGDLKGFAPNYIRVLEDLIGIKFNLVSDTWIDAVKKVKNKEVDGMRFLHITEARQEYMNFTAPYTVVVAAGIWTRKESPEIPSMNDVQDETIGVVSGSSALKYLLDNFPDKNIIEFTTYDEGIDLLVQGKIDVLISPAAMTRYLISSKLIYDLKLTGNIPELTRGIHIGIRKDWPELVAILNKAMAVVPDDVKSRILKESEIPTPEKGKAEVLLTPEEQAWLGKNHVVRVRVSDAPPWEINTPKPQGMSVDYLTIIGRQFGINFKFLPGTDAWIDGFNDMAGDHLKYDLLPAVKRTPERLELLAISDDYLHSPWVVFTHEKIFDIFSLEYLRGRKVTVERGYVMQKILEKNEPEIELVIQESTEDALIAVSTMKADAYVGNLIVTSHLIQRAGIINVKVACPTPFGFHSQAMATRQEWTPLISIINKGLNNISQKEKTNIQNKYSSVRFEHGIRIMDIIKWVVGVSSVLLTILLIIFIWNRKLQQEIIQRKAVEEDLKHTKEEAEAANRSKSMFLANMSHELRTPLNAILGFASHLAHEQDLTSEHHDKVDIIKSSGDHLLKMIDGILSLSRIEAGRVDLQWAPFDLVRTLEDMGQMMTVRSQAKGLRFDLELDAALPRVVQGDVGKMRQVLINLLGNAIKFTQQGYVCLRASTKPLDSDPARVLLQLAVEDSGLGIPEAQLNTIFDSFVQGSQNGDAAQGAGLGLAICKSLVDVMEGRIDVKSKPGEGSLFTVAIPIELAEATALDLEAIRETRVVGLKPGQKPKRILVADDHADNRALLTSMLERVGFTVREVNNGETAVEAFNSWRPHLIFMDIRMPVMDGSAATSAIRQLPGGEKVKILAVTASVFKEQRDEILSAGCDELVCKPVRENEIFDAIGRLLGVQYKYADVEQPAVPDSGIELTQEMLSQLPPEVLSELHQAALVLDRAAMAALVDRIKTHAPDTARSLQRLLDDFQLERIRELLGDVI